MAKKTCRAVVATIEAWLLIAIALGGSLFWLMLGIQAIIGVH